MLRGATWSAAAIAGTAVFRIVVSSDSINTAIATNHGRTRLVEWLGKSWDGIDESQPERVLRTGKSSASKLPEWSGTMNKIMFARSISKYQPASNYLA